MTPPPTAQSRTRERRRTNGWKVAAISPLAAIAVGLGIAGCSTSSETCAKPLLGDKLCGDDLVQWCKQHYDPQINEDTCGQVLRDAGEDPAAIIAAQREKQRRTQAAAQERQRQADLQAARQAEIPATIGQSRKVGDFRLALESIEDQASVSDPSGYSTSRPKPGHHYTIAHVRIRNDQDKPESLCLYENARLIDGKGRAYSPASQATTTVSADSTCGDDLQPGDSITIPLVFEMRDAAQPVAFTAWPPGFSTEAADPHLLVTLR